MTGANASAAYEEWHARMGVDVEANAPWHLMVRTHLDFERDIVERRVLEIGCGRGGFACWLATRADGKTNIVATDFSPEAVRQGEAYARKQGVTGVVWEVGDIQAIAHESRSFDTVVSCETIEHVPDPALAVRELARVLKPRGKLFLTTPNYLGMTGVYRGYLRMIGRRYQEEGQPINNFNILPLTLRWVAKAGLRVTAVDGHGHYLPFPGRSPIRFPALDRARVLTKWSALHTLVVAEKPAEPAE